MEGSRRWHHDIGDRQVAAWVNAVSSLASHVFFALPPSTIKKCPWHSKQGKSRKRAAAITAHYKPENSLGVAVEQSWQAKHQTPMDAREPIQQRLSICCQVGMCLCQGPRGIIACMQTCLRIASRHCASQKVVRAIFGIPLRKAASECISGPPAFGLLRIARGLCTLRPRQLELLLHGILEGDAS